MTKFLTLLKVALSLAAVPLWVEAESGKVKNCHPQFEELDQVTGNCVAISCEATPDPCIIGDNSLVSICVPTAVACVTATNPNTNTSPCPQFVCMGQKLNPKDPDVTMIPIDEQKCKGTDQWHSGLKMCVAVECDSSLNPCSQNTDGNTECVPSYTIRCIRAPCPQYTCAAPVKEEKEQECKGTDQWDYNLKRCIAVDCYSSLKTCSERTDGNNKCVPASIKPTCATTPCLQFTCEQSDPMETYDKERIANEQCPEGESAVFGYGCISDEWCNFKTNVEITYKKKSKRVGLPIGTPGCSSRQQCKWNARKHRCEKKSGYNPIVKEDEVECDPELGEELDMETNKCVAVSCESSMACGEDEKCAPAEIVCSFSPCPQFECEKQCNTELGEELDMETNKCVAVSCESSMACGEDEKCAPAEIVCSFSPCPQFECEKKKGVINEERCEDPNKRYLKGYGCRGENFCGFRSWKAVTNTKQSKKLKLPKGAPGCNSRKQCFWNKKKKKCLHI